MRWAAAHAVPGVPVPAQEYPHSCSRQPLHLPPDPLGDGPSRRLRPTQGLQERTGNIENSQQLRHSGPAEAEVSGEIRPSFDTIGSELRQHVQQYLDALHAPLFDSGEA